MLFIHKPVQMKGSSRTCIHPFEHTIYQTFSEVRKRNRDMYMIKNIQEVTLTEERKDHYLHMTLVFSSSIQLTKHRS